jgi:hypothetical protein
MPPTTTSRIPRTTKKKYSSWLRAISQRLLGLILITGTLLAFAGPPLLPDLYWAVVLVVHVFLVTNAVRLAVGMVITAVKTKKHLDIDWVGRTQEVMAARLKSVKLAEATPIKMSRQMQDQHSMDDVAPVVPIPPATNELTPGQLRQIIIIPNYKEEFETLCETLETLAWHLDAKSTYKVRFQMMMMNGI